MLARRLLEPMRIAGPKSPLVFTSERAAPFSTAGFARMVEWAGKQAKLAFKAHPHKANLRSKPSERYRPARKKDKATRGVRSFVM